MARNKRSGTETDTEALSAFAEAEDAAGRAFALSRICRRTSARSLLDSLRSACGQLVFDDQLASAVFRDRDDPRTFLLKPAQADFQQLPCEPFDELEWIGWLDAASVYVGRYNGDERFHSLSVVFTADTKDFFFASFGVLKTKAYRELEKGGRWPARWLWTGRRKAPPTPPQSEPAEPIEDPPRDLQGIFAEIAAEVSKAMTTRDMPDRWAQAVLDARWVPNGRAFASVLKIRDAKGKKVKEETTSFVSPLLREAYQRRKRDGEQWHGLLIVVDRAGKFQVRFNLDPKCAAAPDLYE